MPGYPRNYIWLITFNFKRLQFCAQAPCLTAVVSWLSTGSVWRGRARGHSRWVSRDGRGTATYKTVLGRVMKLWSLTASIYYLFLLYRRIGRTIALSRIWRWFGPNRWLQESRWGELQLSSVPSEMVECLTGCQRSIQNQKAWMLLATAPSTIPCLNWQMLSSGARVEPLHKCGCNNISTIAQSFLALCILCIRIARQVCVDVAWHYPKTKL